MNKTYKINLRGINTENYKLNPVVLQDWDYANIEAVIGRAMIISKSSVEIDYREGMMPKWDHTIGMSYVENEGKKELVALATIPKSKQAGYRCYDCEKVCKSPSGLSLHVNAMHLKLSPSQIKQAKK